MKSTRSVIILFVLVILVSLAFVSAAVAAGPDPKAAPAAGQGTLEIRNLDHEITVAYAGTGYTLHRFGTLRLAADAGQNDFDYFCGGQKYFVGDVKVTAGKTTIVTLQAGGCTDTIVSEPPPPTSIPGLLDPYEMMQAYAVGHDDGYNCRGRNMSYSPNPIVQMQYNQGYNEGFALATCN